MAESEDTVATSVHDYVPSLWHVVGQFPARVALTALVDQFHNDMIAARWPRYPSVLITGKTGMGRRHLGQCLHHAMGNLDWKEPAHVLGTSEDCIPFWQSITDASTIFIPHLTRLPASVIGQLIRLVRDGYIPQPSCQHNETALILNNLLILSAEEGELICNDLLKHVTLRCALTPYTNDHIFQILSQRTKALRWHAEEPTLRLLAQNAANSPTKALRGLQYAYMMSRAGDTDDCIQLHHAKQAIVLNSGVDTPAARPSLSL